MNPTVAGHAGRYNSAYVVVSCCIAGIGEGFDNQAPGVTLPILAMLFPFDAAAGRSGLFELLTGAKGLFLGASSVGLLVGAILGGRLSDRIGRKPVALGAIIAFAALSGLTAHASSIESLLWCRFLTGLGLGGALPNLLAIIAENASQRRTLALGCFYASMPFGGALAALSTFVFGTVDRWQMIYYLGGIIPLLALPGLAIALKNSVPTARRQRTVPVARAVVLFGARYRVLTIWLWLGFVAALSAMYILLGWLPSLLVGKGLTRMDASLVQLSFNLSGAVGGIIAGVLMGGLNRTRNILLMFLSAIIALAALAVAPGTLIVSILLGSLVGVTVATTQTSLYALAPICYSTEIRGTGVGYAVAAGRVGSILGPLVVGAMVMVKVRPIEILFALVPLMIIAGAASTLISKRIGSNDRID